MPNTTKHVHHWHIEPARGPTSVGRCKCGGVRTFNNSSPDVHPYQLRNERRKGVVRG